MRIALLSLGTRGDVALMATLGRRLAERGAEVTLAASPFYEADAARAGLGFERVGEGAFDEMRAALGGALADPSPMRRTERFFQSWIRPQLLEGEATLDRLASGADYFVSNLKIAAASGRRPTARVTYDPPRDLADLDRFGAVRPEVIDLVALPRELLDPTGRCDPRYEFTGFWLPQEIAGAEAPPELERFVSAKEGKVLTVTLGSMPIDDPSALRSTVAEAAEAAGLRCVLVGAWSGVAPGVAPGLDEEGSLLVTAEAPYDWLFARSACVVHHGGVGAAGMTIRAGVPAVIAPLLGCQHEMADLLGSAGIAAGKVEDIRREPGRLAELVCRATSDPELRGNAADWKERLRRDRGADLAAQRIFEHYERLFG